MCSCDCGARPRGGPLFIVADLGVVQQRLGDGIEAAQEPLSLGLGYFEGKRTSRAVGSVKGDGEILKVDRRLGTSGPPSLCDRVPGGLGKLDRQEAVVVGVAFED